MKIRAVLLTIFFCTSGFIGYGQVLKKLNPPMDSTYITDHVNDLTVRLYASRKFTAYTLGQYRYAERLAYKPNDNQNIGFGFNYKFIGINIGFRAPFINNDKDKYGKTKYLDLQSYIYMRAVTLDLYGQFYNGYYLANRKAISDPIVKDVFPLRPDMKTRNLGFTAQYIFNHRRFSYRAPYLHNEYQKKSAGSALIGTSMHFVNIKADSNIIPSNIAYPGFFDGRDFNKSSIAGVAVNGGYAQTFVIKRHFFVTGALLAGFGVNYTWLTNSGVDTREGNWETQQNLTVRMAAGYNSDRYFAGVHYVNFITRNNAPGAGNWQEFGGGNLRFSIAKRFKIKKDLIKEIKDVTIKE